jgi:hypothetical protein
MPNVAMIHHSHEFSPVAKSVEFFTMSVHFARDNPNPESAPYLQNREVSYWKKDRTGPAGLKVFQSHLAAMVWQKHMRSRNPIQLNKKEVRKAVKKTKSFPRRASSETSASSESSKDGNVRRNPTQKNRIGSALSRASSRRAGKRFTLGRLIREAHPSPLRSGGPFRPLKETNGWSLKPQRSSGKYYDTLRGFSLFFKDTSKIGKTQFTY